MTKQVNARSDCPPAATLSAWRESELNSAEMERQRHHLRDCGTCREQVNQWLETAGALRSAPLAPAAVTPACFDDETLAAYCDDELHGEDAAYAELHLRKCGHCTAAVHRAIALRVAMDESVGAGPSLLTASSTRPEPVRVLEGPAGWRTALRELARAAAQTLARPWPMAGAVAAATMLAVVITRLLPSGDGMAGVRFRGVAEPPRFEVAADNVAAHTRPGDDQPTVVTLQRGASVKRLEQSAEWSRIELADGRRVWVRSTEVAAVRATP